MEKAETNAEIAKRLDAEADSFMPTVAMLLMMCSPPAKLVVATKMTATLIGLAAKGNRDQVDKLISTFEIGLRAEIDRQWQFLQDAPALAELLKKEMSGASTN